MLYIVTIKLPKNPEHNPHDKKTGECAVSALCTDVTGEHHSLLVEATDDAVAAVVARRHGYQHVTRVEALSDLPLI